MDKQEYLNEISASTRPVAPPKKSIFSSKILWVILAGVVAFVILAIIGALISGSGSSVKDRLYALITRIDNTSAVIDEYRSDIKSSSLRSDTASLSTILSNTSKSLTDYATAKYNYKPKDVKQSVQEEETLAKDALTDELFKAKINGLLDDTFAHKMAYEVSIIMTREAQLMKSTSDDLYSILDGSYQSLDILYHKFDNFSETQ